MSLETLRAQNRLIEEPGAQRKTRRARSGERPPEASHWRVHGPWLSKHPLKKGFKKEEIRARKTSDAGQT